MIHSKLDSTNNAAEHSDITNFIHKERQFKLKNPTCCSISLLLYLFSYYIHYSFYIYSERVSFYTYIQFTLFHYIPQLMKLPPKHRMLRNLTQNNLSNRILLIVLNKVPCQIQYTLESLYTQTLSLLQILYELFYLKIVFANTTVNSLSMVSQSLSTLSQTPFRQYSEKLYIKIIPPFFSPSRHFHSFYILSTRSSAS